jgi:hypothetical protein
MNLLLWRHTKIFFIFSNTQANKLAKFEIVEIITKDYNRSIYMYWKNINRKLPEPVLKNIKKLSINEYLNSKAVWKMILKNIETDIFNYDIKVYIEHNNILIKYWDKVCQHMNYNDALKFPQWRIILSHKMKHLSDKYIIIDKEQEEKINKKNIIQDVSLNYKNIDISSDISIFKKLKQIHYTLSDENIIKVFDTEFTDFFKNNYIKILTD